MSTPPRQPYKRVAGPFMYREYRLFIAAVALSVFATGMWTVVMVLQVIAIASDPAALSLVAACWSTGLVTFVLVGGLAADRLRQRAIIIAVESVNTAAVTTIAVLSHTHQLHLWQMAAGSFVLGAGAAFIFPAYGAYLPTLLPSEQLLPANGIEGVLRPVMQQAAGPALAGFLVEVSSPVVGASVVAALHAICLIPLISMRKVEAGRQVQRPRTRPLSDLVNGFRFMLTTPWLLGTLLFASGFVLFTSGPLRVLLPFIADARFTHGERAYGFALAAFGIGGAFGAIAVASMRLPRRYLTVMIACWGLGSLPLVAVGYTTSFAVMASAAFVVGMTSSAATVIWGSVLQLRVPHAMLGRASSLDFFVGLLFMPLSMALVGALSKVLAIQLIFLASGIIPIILGVVVWLVGRMAVDEDEHPLHT